MTTMKFVKKVPASLLGIGGPYQPGQEYPLPDDVAAGLIATKDPDWKEVKVKSNQSEENYPGVTGKGSPGKGRNK